MAKLIDLSGQKFGRLTAISNFKKPGNGIIFWNCVCDCGGTATPSSQSLREGLTQSCGCLQREATSAANTTHGKSPYPNPERVREYTVWTSMRGRCLNITNPAFAHYGGRGIRICERWDDFTIFLNDMGHAPGPDYSLDRVDNNGNYCPENCRWATKKEQARNRRSNRFLEYNGEIMTMAEWSDRVGIPYAYIPQRLYRGWSIEDTLMTPVGGHKHSQSAGI